MGLDILCTTVQWALGNHSGSFYVGSEKITMKIKKEIKDTAELRAYEVWEWPGNTNLWCFVYTDPFIAATSCIDTRASLYTPSSFKIEETENEIFIVPSLRGVH